MRQGLDVAAAVLFGALPAYAQVGLPWPGPGTAHSVGGGGYTGPGDVVSSATFFLGVRAYDATYATALGALLDWSCTNGTLKTGTLHATSTGVANATEMTAIASDCGVVTPGMNKWYNQVSPGTGDVSNSGTQIDLILSGCPGSTNPCLFTPGTPGILSGTIAATITTPWTIAAVAERTGGTGAIGWIAAKSGTWAVGFNSSVNQAVQYGGNPPPQPTATATDNALHALAYEVNGASSNITVDGSATSGSSGTNSITGNFAIGAADDNTGPMQGYIFEVGLWPSGFTTSLCHNQFAYYGTVTSC